MRPIGAKSCKDVMKVVEEVFLLLDSTQVLRPGIAGWHQYLGSGKIGNIATSQVLQIYDKYKREPSNVIECVETLRRNVSSFHMGKQTFRGWSYASSGPPVPCVEPTFWAISALSTVNRSEADLVNEANLFFVGTRRVSEEGSSWGFTPFTEPRVTATCIAIHALYKIGNYEVAREGIRWILSARGNHKGWGASRNSPPTLSHTAIVLMMLADTGETCQHPDLSNAVEFLNENILPYLCSRGKIFELGESAGFQEIIEVPSYPGLVERPSRISYYYNPLALTASAIAKSNARSPVVYGCAMKIIDLWYNKRWKHRYLTESSHCTSWSIYNNLEAIWPVYVEFRKKPLNLIFYYCGKTNITVLSLPFLGWVASKKTQKVFRFCGRVIIHSFIIGLMIYLFKSDIKLNDSILSVILSVIANYIYSALTHK